jgi:hypothetical protein
MGNNRMRKTASGDQSASIVNGFSMQHTEYSAGGSFVSVQWKTLIYAADPPLKIQPAQEPWQAKSPRRIGEVHICMVKVSSRCLKDGEAPSAEVEMIRNSVTYQCKSGQCWAKDDGLFVRSGPTA